MGGGGVSPPQQVTLGQSIGDITSTEPWVYGAESQYQPQYQQLGQGLSLGSLQNFGNTMEGTINPAAGYATNQQYQQQTGLYGANAPAASQAINANNPYIGQGAAASQGLIGQGQYNQSQANSMISGGQGIINNSQGVLGNAQNILRSAQGIDTSSQGAINSNSTLAGLNNTVNSNLSGIIPQSTIAQIAQGSGAAFSANGLFNSGNMAASNLLNQANYQQNRQQQWTSLGNQVQGLNAQQQQNAIAQQSSLAGIGGQYGNIGSSLGSIGGAQQQQGVNLSNYSGMQGYFGMGGLQNAGTQLQSGIQSLISPGQYNANLQSLTSSFAPGQVTPQIIPQELGTATGLNEFNAQGQFAANAANAQMQNQQTASELGLGAAGIAALGSIFGGAIAACWIAREVFGIDNINWVQFYNWMIWCAPNWFVNLYKKHGEKFAQFIHDKPIIKYLIRSLMSTVIEEEYGII